MSKKLVKIKNKIREDDKLGRKNFDLMHTIMYDGKSTDLEKAYTYYCLNKTCYSGLTEIGKFSITALQKSFTINNISRLKEMSKVLRGTTITNGDYETMISKDKNIFIYLDPPYALSKDKNNLYGKDGELHKNFDHKRFFEVCKKSKNKLLVSYNDDEYVREGLKDFDVVEWTNSGAMQHKDGKNRPQKELLFKNY